MRELRFCMARLAAIIQLLLVMAFKCLGQLCDRFGQGTGGASGESDQDIIWLSSKSVQCAETRTGWLRW